MSAFPWLSAIIFAPWLGGLVLACWRRGSVPAIRAVALVFSLSTLVLTLLLLAAGRFDPAVPTMQLEVERAWIPTLNVRYHVGLDGMSLLLVLLTGIVAPMALAASWREAAPSRLLASLFLFLQGSALGVFLALDFFLWFIFWELSLFPAFFLIKLWGGPQRTRAAYQFVIYTIGGSAFMLLGFAAIFGATGTLDFLDLAARAARDGGLGAVLGPLAAQLVFLGVLLGVAVKAPLFPFHTWLPLAYAEAPTGVSMFLTAVMSKMGVYGFFRVVWPIFPAELGAAADVLLVLALAGVVFGAYAAMRQRDLKRLVAYSSVNHVSYCLLALFAVVGATAAGPAPGASVAAFNGALLQMFNHGITAAALFYFVGVLEARAGRRGLHDFGGLRAVAPVFAGLCGLAMFASLGLPGLNGFVGEFLIFRGVIGLAPWAAAVACLGLLATAIFLLTFYQRVFHGPARADALAFRDLSAREVFLVAPVVALMFVVGICPQVLLGFLNPLATAWTGGAP